MALTQRLAFRIAPLGFLATAGLLLAEPEPAPPADKPTRGRDWPTLVVETIYPGADAQIVAEAVAAPIEQQLVKIEHVRYLRSRCANDGKYTLVIAFKSEADLDAARKAVQKQIEFALPVLPEAVRQNGVPVVEKSPGPLAILSVSSPDHTRDSLFLSDLARSRVRDKLARLPGVSRVSLIGAREGRIRIWIDADRLTARNLTADDVIRALPAQPNKPAPTKESTFELAANPADRLVEVDRLAKLVVKTDSAGQIVRLDDVARIEFGMDARGDEAILNGEPVVLLAVAPTWRASLPKLIADIRGLMEQTRRDLPSGVDLGLFHDFTPNLDPGPRAPATSLALVDLTLPAASSAEQTRQTPRRCAEMARSTAGVRDVLTLTSNPFDLFGGGPCLLVHSATSDKDAPDREQLRRGIRSGIEMVPGLEVRLRDITGLSRSLEWNYPVGLALHGSDMATVLQLGEKLVQQLRQTDKLSDVTLDPASRPQPKMHLDIDRAKCLALDVKLADVTDMLQTITGGLSRIEMHRFNRTLDVALATGAGGPNFAEALKQAKIRNSKNQMVPLMALVAVRQILAPAVIDHLNGKPMVEITANLAPAVSPVQARELCERLAHETIKGTDSPTEYGLTWLRDMPVNK
jgi:multidrug efflux pump subunit AcrB